MREKTFSEKQIALALRHAETGTPDIEDCRKMWASEKFRNRRPFVVSPVI